MSSGLHSRHLQPPTALEYFSTLVADDASLATFEAAVSIAQDEEPQLDAQAVLHQVDALGERLRRRLPADAAPMARLRSLNQYFFQELGFAGNVNDYYDPSNSYLHRVLATRRGIPITLALLYIELAGHVGLQARGIAFPGHFLVKLHMPQGEVVLDPFNGRSLSREQLDEWLQPWRQRQGLQADDEAPLELFLQAAPAREVLARMLRNLKEIHRSADDWLKLLPVLERLVVLLPQDWEERRDRGLCLAELGRWEAAAADLAQYLRQCPQAADAPALRLRLDELRRHGQPRLH